MEIRGERATRDTAPVRRVTVVAMLPLRTTSTLGHRRPAPSDARPSSSHGQSGSASQVRSASSSPGHSGSSSHGKSGSSHGRSGSSHGKSASSPGHSESSSHGNSASSNGNSATSNGKGHAKSSSSAHGVGKQTAPGQLKKTVAATEQYATAQTSLNRGLGAAKKVGTDVPGSTALTSGKAHK